MMDMLCYTLEKGFADKVNSYRVASSDIAGNRNKIFQMAKKDDCDYLFMVDTDMVLPKNCIEQFLELEKIMPDCLLTGYAGVGGEPFYPAAWIDPGNGEGGIIWETPDVPFEAHFIGGYALFIPKSILRSSDIPEDPFTLRDGDRGEDFAFSRTVREAGFKILVDPRIEFGHLRPQKIGKAHWEAQKKKLGLRPEDYVQIG